MDIWFLSCNVVLGGAGAVGLAACLWTRRRLQEQSFVAMKQSRPDAWADGVAPADWRVFAAEWGAYISTCALGLFALGVVAIALEQIRIRH